MRFFTIDKSIYFYAKKKGINLSRTINQLLNVAFSQRTDDNEKE